MRILFGLMLSSLLILSAANTRADEPFWQPFVDQQTLAVAVAPIDDATWSPVLDEVVKHQPVAGRLVRSAMVQLNSSGATQVAVMVGVPDIQRQAGPVAIVSTLAGESAAVQQQLQQLVTLAETTQLANGLVRTLAKGNLVLIGTDKSLKRYAAMLDRNQENPRTDLATAMSEVRGDPSAAIVFSPGFDARRVIRELWPNDLGLNIDGPLLADGLRYVAGRFTLGPMAELRIDLVGSDEPTAKRLVKPAAQAVAAAVGELGRRVPESAALEFLLLQSLRPQRVGTRVSVTARRDDPVIDRLLKQFMQPLVADAVERALSQQRRLKFMQIALAMHNYHDVFDHFPTSDAIRDADGTPLLSWRVAVLPYIEQGELYKKFRLDEPWDSPHNMALVKQMPKVFADPARNDLAQQGWTSYQVPLGEQAFFSAGGETVKRKFLGREAFFGKGNRFRDMTDGTSNLLMIVEVAPERAVPWTKPSDWEVDLAKPMAGLRQAGRKTILSSRADGSAHVVQADMDEQEFGKALTRNGRELLDRNKW